MASSISIRSYSSGLLQREHAHSSAHISFVLRGSFTEGSTSGERRIGPGMCALRPMEFSHQVLFGVQGALVISMQIADAHHSDSLSSHWVQAPAPMAKLLLEEARRSEADFALQDSIWDALTGSVRLPGRKCPPGWLILARDRLIEEDIAVAALAADAGVHRVYFSRAFSEAFGAPPTLFRRRIRSLRAAAAAIEGRGAADSALGCGFADQSHMARCLRRETGTSFRGLTELRAKVTSVQD